MTRQERSEMVRRAAAGLGLEVVLSSNNHWFVRRNGQHAGMLVYNQRSGAYKALGGGALASAVFGGLETCLRAFAGK